MYRSYSDFPNILNNAPSNLYLLVQNLIIKITI